MAPSMVLAFGGLAGLLALGVLIWNQRLRRQLRLRTAEVIELEARFRAAVARAEESRQRFEDLVDQSPAVFELFDTNGVLVQVNSAFEELWQLPRSDVVGKFNVFESQQVADLGLLPYFERAFAGERTKPPDVEFDASREEVAKGRSRKRWISSLLYPIKDHAGAVEQVVMIHEDITDRVAAERARSKSEDRLRLALEGTNTGIYEWYPETGEVYLSPTWFSMLGYEPDAFPHAYESWAELLHPEDRSQAERTLGDLLRQGTKTLDMEFRLRAKDGTYRWMHAQGAAVEWNDAGQIVRLVGIDSDITQQKEAEERLRAYQERLRALAGELTATEERERRRIATVLHDGAAQSLAFARMQLAAVSKVLTDPAAAAQLDELSTLLQQSLQQVREILLDLSSPALNELGLAAALSEWLGQQVGERHGLQTAFADASGDLPLTEDARSLLFRNARELMANAVKHAQARKVTLSMDRRADALRIRVQDDGSGFDPREPANRPDGHGAFGLFSIRERMADLGGSLEIVSRPGAGTEAILIAPLDRLT